MQYHALSCLIVVSLLTPVTAAQFTDRQPGRNYPTAVVEFGAGFSESVDFGDVDNDGDLDVIVGNGGDGNPQPNRIFINQGGLQGGTTGAFSEETAARFAGVPDDRTRDLDFGDVDNDGDLDVFVTNRGTSFSGTVSRFYVNQGGLQGGTSGFYVEETATRWGGLASVPAGDQVFGGNQGPWRGWSCDCDFGDIDDDGDADLFVSSYGPNISGTEPSRVFLNDGTGVFDELFPWADAAADIRWHTLDVELADLDDDFDLDLFASSRDSQARVFNNNLRNPLPGATTLFTDTTQHSIIDQGATATQTNNYDTELGDLDGDGDFDLWMLNYTGFSEAQLVNEGFEAGLGVVFTEVDAVFADPNIDENEVDLLDFDADGDLDAFTANFSGTNYLFVSGVAQGMGMEFHRAGASTSGGLYTFPETPVTSNTGTTRDADVGDLDGDGDEDIVLGNDNSQDNRLWFNTLGIPDTHAPTFRALTPTVEDSGVSVVHAAVRDNSPFYVVNSYLVELVWNTAGAPEQRVAMTCMGSQLFRGEIDLGGGTTNFLQYHIEATDAAGNVGVSETVSFGLGWSSLGLALAGTAGDPRLAGAGALAAGTAGSVTLDDARPSALFALFFGPPGPPVPFKGGLLATNPPLLLSLFTTDGTGAFSIPFVMPNNVEAGAAFHVQAAIDDPVAVQGVALSNALLGVVP